MTDRDKENLLGLFTAIHSAARHFGNAEMAARAEMNMAKVRGENPFADMFGSVFNQV